VLPVVCDMGAVPIDAGCLDRVFCVSVLEETSNPAAVLKEFGRLLAPDGRVVLTFDVPHDPARGLGRCKGYPLNQFWADVAAAGLVPDGENEVAIPREPIIYHEEFNLCCYHALLKHA